MRVGEEVDDCIEPTRGFDLMHSRVFNEHKLGILETDLHFFPPTHHIEVFPASHHAYSMLVVGISYTSVTSLAILTNSSTISTSSL